MKNWQKRDWCECCGGKAEGKVAIFSKSLDGSFWECENCHARRPAKVRKGGPRTEMTPAQAKTLEAFKGQVMYHWSMGRPCEWKKIEGPTFIGNAATFFLEFGEVGDEGDARSIFCRRTYHVSIGSNGGIKPVYWPGPKSEEPKGIFKVAVRGTDYKGKK